MDWSVVPANLPFLLGGLAISAQLAGITIVCSLPLGCLVAIGRMSHRKWINRPSTAFVHLLRSNPLVLILFWFYFLAPVVIARPIGDFGSAVIGFIAFFTAYFTEIVRAGIQSVGVTQMQAGLATGLSYPQTMRFVILPQAIRHMLPALVTQCIVVFHGTTVASVIGLSELLHRTSLVAERTLRPVELYTFVAAVYLVVGVAGSRVASYLK